MSHATSTGSPLTKWAFAAGCSPSPIGGLRTSSAAPPASPPNCSLSCPSSSVPSDEARSDGLDWALTLVRRLPPDQADAVLLRVVADLDVASVARILHKNEGAVRVLTHRGLHRLAELASPDVGNPSDAVTPAAPPAMEGAS